MQAEIELIAARVDEGRVRYLVTSRPSAARTDPDATARSAVAQLFPALAQDRGVVHSTSWRFENEVLTLTYLAYSDDLPVAELPKVLPPSAKPDGEGVTSVVAHAIRHLAFLCRKDPSECSPLPAETRAYLARIEPELAGRIYPERAA